MIRWEDLSAQERDVIVAVTTAPNHPHADISHGMSVIDEFNENRSDPIASSRLYRVFSDLERKGLIEREEINGRDRGVRLRENARELLRNRRDKLARSI